VKIWLIIVAECILHSSFKTLWGIIEQEFSCHESISELSGSLCAKGDMDTFLWLTLANGASADLPGTISEHPAPFIIRNNPWHSNLEQHI
jgi:hypothetical protein